MPPEAAELMLEPVKNGPDFGRACAIVSIVSKLQ